MWTQCAPQTVTHRQGHWNHIRDMTWATAGRLASREAAAPPITEHTVFLKVNLLFASAGNGPLVRWQGCEPCDTGGKSNTTARAPAPVSVVWGQQRSAWLLITHYAAGNKPRPDLTPHTIRSSQNHLEHTALVQTHRRPSSLMARGQVFYTCSPSTSVLCSLSLQIDYHRL